MRIEDRFISSLHLKDFSTFGIGGPIRYYLKANSAELIQEGIQWAICKKVPYFILGKGSNCLFHDCGFNGLIIHHQMDFCSFNGTIVKVGAGFSFSHLGVQTAKNNLSGLEFAAGIPGSVGGAIYMNAGANGQETAQVLQEVSFIDESGEIQTFPRDHLTFQHRKSSFQSMKGSILEAQFQLQLDPMARKKQIEHLQYRMATQPLKEKSAGCTFKNPPGFSAGALIDQCGLKGTQCGQAKVSEMHANFIINLSDATQSDILTLMKLVQNEVHRQKHIWLEPEIRIVPFE